MKLIKAKCVNNKIIEFEDKGTGIGVCPSYCQAKKYGICHNTTFRYRRVLSANVVADYPYQPDSATQTDNTTASSSKHDQAPVKPVDTVEPSAFGSQIDKLEDTTSNGLFLDEEQWDSIPYYDPFAEPEQPQVVVNNAKNIAATRSTGVDKYNAMINATGLFSAVKPHNSNEPCFVDGVKKFYVDYNTKGASGDAASALKYIFLHWYTSKVFKVNGTEYTENFLYLLKLCNFSRFEKELTELLNDVSLDINSKFFHLFYRIIYKNQLSGFYWSDCESSFCELIPIFSSQSDFITKMLSIEGDFFQDISKYLSELLLWLQSFNENAVIDKQWFLDQIPLLIAEYAKQVAFVDNSNGELNIVRLGSIRNFINSFTELESYDTMQNKYKFLSRFSVLITGRVVVRNGSFGGNASAFKVDDSVYELLGLRGASSYCASYFNFYVSILKEYIDVFHPSSVRIGGLEFKLRDFYNKALNIVQDGYACMLSESDIGNRRAVFFLTKSLFERGVFEYYENNCETTKLQTIKKLLTQKIDPKAYFACPDVEHIIIKNGQTFSIAEYLESILEEKVNRELPKNASIFKSKMIQAYFEAKIDSDQLASLRKEIDTAVSESEKILVNFTK